MATLDTSVASIVVLAGCSFGRSLDDLVATNGLRPDALVRLSDDRLVAANVDPGNVRVMDFTNTDGGWIRTELAFSGLDGNGPFVNLLSYGGETGEEWSTIVYGAAPPGVVRVELAGYTGEGGQVVDGGWVIVLREKDLGPDDLVWKFLDASGNVVASGTGIIG